MPDQQPLTAADWHFLAYHRFARLATVDDAGRPSIVPICFAADGEAIYSALDEKPKRVDPLRLRRVRNLLRHPAVALLVDDVFEDWDRLAFLLVHGTAELVWPGTDRHTAAIALLRARYPRYAGMALERRPVIRIVPTAAFRWAARPAEAEAPAPPRDLDLYALIQGRRSVRALRPDPVPPVLIERVLEAARWAPSPHGRMPWRFVVLTRPEAKARLAAAMGAEWERQLALDGEPPEVIARRKERSHQRIRDAPVCILLCLYLVDLDHYPDPVRQEAETTMAVQSLGAAAQNLLLAAYREGLDCGWMCAPLFCPETVRAALGLPPDLHPHALITMGYAARDPVRRERLPLEALVVRWE
jgi:coenzyme F420-0:L-glutamate ligase/coenzyme F420-1:gamma-L-glutamate ligase